MPLTAQNTLDFPHLSKISGTEFRPIFILGDHRAGTTLLYKLLAETGHFNFVNAYHVIRYAEILHNFIQNQEQQARQTLAAELRSLSIQDRAIDKIQPTPDLPEEYGFIFKQFGFEPYLTHQTQPLFHEICQKIQFISDPHKPLLLKNPWDFRQFLNVYHCYPKAQFIFLHRHPVHMLNSKIKALRTLLSERDPYMALLLPWYREFFDSPLQQGIYRLIYSSRLSLDYYQLSKQAIKTTTYFAKNINKIPIEQHLSIKYEDLCNNPRSTVVSIFNFLNLPRTDDPYEDWILPRPIHLIAEATQNYANLCKKFSPYMSFLEY